MYLEFNFFSKYQFNFPTLLQPKGRGQLLEGDRKGRKLGEWGEIVAQKREIQWKEHVYAENQLLSKIIMD